MSAAASTLASQIAALLDRAAASGGPLRREVPLAVARALAASEPLPDELVLRLAGEWAEWLRSQPDALAAAAVESLGSAAAATRALTSMLRDALEGLLGAQDEAVRRRALPALAAIGELPAVRQALSDPSEAVSVRAAAVLAQAGELQHALRLLSRAQGPARPLLLLALRHASAAERADAVGTLRRALYSVERDERRAAIRALRELLPESLPALLGAAEDDPDAVLRAQAALAAASQSPAGELIARLLADANPEVRALAVAARAKEPGALFTVLEALGDEASEVVLAALAAAARLHAREALPLLEALADDADPAVRRAVALSRARIERERAPLAGLLAAADPEALLALWELDSQE